MLNIYSCLLTSLQQPLHVVLWPVGKEVLQALIVSVAQQWVHHTPGEKACSSTSPLLLLQPPLSYVYSSRHDLDRQYPQIIRRTTLGCPFTTTPSGDVLSMPRDITYTCMANARTHVQSLATESYTTIFYTAVPKAGGPAHLRRTHKACIFEGGTWTQARGGGNNWDL